MLFYKMLFLGLWDNIQIKHQLAEFSIQRYTGMNETSEKLNKLILALKEYSKNHPDLVTVLKRFGIF